MAIGVQAAGYATTFSPAKLVQATGAGGAWTGGMQDALLTGAAGRGRRQGCAQARRVACSPPLRALCCARCPAFWLLRDLSPSCRRRCRASFLQLCSSARAPSPVRPLVSWATPQLSWASPPLGSTSPRSQVKAATGGPLLLPIQRMLCCSARGRGAAKQQRMSRVRHTFAELHAALF